MSPFAASTSCALWPAMSSFCDANRLVCLSLSVLVCSGGCSNCLHARWQRSVLSVAWASLSDMQLVAGGNDATNRLFACAGAVISRVSSAGAEPPRDRPRGFSFPSCAELASHWALWPRTAACSPPSCSGLRTLTASATLLRWHRASAAYSRHRYRHATLDAIVGGAESSGRSEAPAQRTGTPFRASSLLAHHNAPRQSRLPRQT
mmetsp:Transcript_46146/g.114808  ORF Transcript_46146/g.114808 Transcript_46146/m.114808 type:complete len:205 (-) Transcript_46146:21-635(-)